MLSFVVVDSGSEGGQDMGANVLKGIQGLIQNLSRGDT